jgi:polar amino acid transport system substrate-binding protein
MRKFIALITVLIIVVGLTLAGCGDDAVSTTNTYASKVYVTSGHPEWWPVMYQGSGVGYDVLAKVASMSNFSTKYEYKGDWESVLEAGKNGTVDIFPAYKTTDREKYCDFSEPFMTDPVAIFVKTGQGFVYTKFEDLIGKRGVAMTGDSYGQQLDDYIISSLTVTRVANSAEAFELLSNGQADYFFYSYYAGIKEISSKYKGLYEPLPTYVAEENFYFAISKKSSLVAYLPQINDAITKCKNDGTIDKLLEGYLQQLQK